MIFNDNKRTIRQHYVPRFYLKNFALERKGEQFETSAFNLNSNRFFSVNIEKIGLEKKFYDIEENGELIYSMESELQKLENDMAPALRMLIKKEDIDKISKEFKEQIAKLCSTLSLRISEERNRIQEFAKIIKKGLNNSSHPLAPVIAETIPVADEEIKKLSLEIMKDSLLDDTEEFKNMKWSIGKAETGVYIYTSDNPVIIFNPKYNDYSGYGYAKEGAQIILPLTPKLILLMYHEGDYNIDDFFEFNEEYASKVKTLLIKHAERFLFAKNKKHFDIETIKEKRSNNSGVEFKIEELNPEGTFIYYPKNKK
jgi:hypothetical protein